MIAMIGILDQVGFGSTTPYDVTLSIATIDGAIGYSASFDVKNPLGTVKGTASLSVAAPANGNSDTDTLGSGPGLGWDVDATGTKASGTALSAGTVVFKRNGSNEHTVNFGFGDVVTGSYTYLDTLPGDQLEIVITEI